MPRAHRSPGMESRGMRGYPQGQAFLSEPGWCGQDPGRGTVGRPPAQGTPHNPTPHPVQREESILGRGTGPSPAWMPGPGCTHPARHPQTTFSTPGSPASTSSERTGRLRPETSNALALEEGHAMVLESGPPSGPTPDPQAFQKARTLTSNQNSPWAPKGTTAGAWPAGGHPGDRGRGPGTSRASS